MGAGWGPARAHFPPLGHDINMKGHIMANKPIPQDHKPKAEKAEKADVVATTRTINDREVEGFEVTHRGFTVFAQKEALDDFEVLDAIAKLDNRKVHAFPDVLRRVVGEDFRIVMNVLRDPVTGRVSIESGVTYVHEMLGAINPNG